MHVLCWCTLKLVIIKIVLLSGVLKIMSSKLKQHSLIMTYVNCSCCIVPICIELAEAVYLCFMLIVTNMTNLNYNCVDSYHIYVWGSYRNNLNNL